MRISRRDLIKAGLVAGATVSTSSVLQAHAAPTAARTVRMVMNGDLRVFDPVFTTATITGNHGLAIYDTLFSSNSKFAPKPQMIGKWGVSDNNKTYTFELRDGLAWHDGTHVTAADCVASIRRWGQADAGGRLILARAQDISKKDEKTFTISLKEPLPLLITILGSGQPLFIMREKDAARPPNEQVTANIGSGPLKFNEALAKPGASFTYDRNEQYVPRDEPSDGFAGGKIVKVDRVIWENISDKQTAFAALQAGEIDFFESPPADLYPVIETDPNLALQTLNKTGSALSVRINFLQKPFDNVKARRALLYLIDQEAFLRVMCPDPKYGRTVTSIFGNDTPYSNEENTHWFKTGGDPARAKQLFQEAGYAGEKIVILDPTNIVAFNDASQLLAAALRKIGVNAELAPMEWGEVVTRRANKGPIESGGWNIFITSNADYTLGDPIGTPALLASGDKAWYGWPRNEEYEGLRAKWADVPTLEDRLMLANKMQALWWDFVGSVFLGQVVLPIARRKSLTDIIGMTGYTAMWNMQKV
ncbi:ABC transporter substrate-binding protein [Bradyrhizobium sp. 15]|nr:ABC transporter substrate-binding protein [Bradyrhizobium sp. 15]